jgi:hypothetical protein
MTEWNVAFDGGSPQTRKTILYRLNERLKNEPGIEYTRFEPERTAPTEVVASVNPTAFLGRTYPAPVAVLVVWWSPRTAGNDHFRIQWYEAPDREGKQAGESNRAEERAETADPTLPEEYTLSCGWHQDDHFDGLGEAHFQEEYPGEHMERYGVTFGDVTPLWILSECLEALPTRLDGFRRRLQSG